VIIGWGFAHWVRVDGRAEQRQSKTCHRPAAVGSECGFDRENQAFAQKSGACATGEMRSCVAAGLSKNATRCIKMGALRCMGYMILRKLHRSETPGFSLITFSFWDTPREERRRFSVK
jgi:hypothetical protein